MFLTKRLYILLAIACALCAAGAAVPLLFEVGKVFLWLIVIAFVIDCTLLWRYKKGITARRTMAERFSNGDDNEVDLRLESSYPYSIKLSVIDEIPVEFQDRNMSFALSLQRKEGKNIIYKLRPTERGSYKFGLIRVFVRTVLGLVERRYSLGSETEVKVYPSYLMLHRYELLAISDRLTDLGIKRIRRIGNNTDFSQIRDYVVGDDYRSINWKATARRHQLMVNVFQQERSQQVFNVIDKGRVMRQSWRGMTLLDYSINASLVLSYVAMSKEDKAGLLTFCDGVETSLPASRQGGQMQSILEALYKEKATFGESDFSALVDYVNRHITRRSLLILYTSFFDKTSLERQLPYLRQLDRRHRLLVVFFEDRELREFVERKPETNEEYYQQTIARKYAAEQRLIVSELRQNGITALLTLPENLSVNVINKYLEMKARNMLG